MCKNIQAFTQHLLGKCFGNWARVVMRCDWCLLITFTIVYLGLSCNLANYTEFYDQKAIWTSEVSASIHSNDPFLSQRGTKR